MKMYNAAVEVDRKGSAVDEDQVDELMTELAAYHVAVGTSPRGWLEARISLPAETLVQAMSTALAVVESAAGAAAIAVEVMTEDEFTAREGFEPNVPELLGVTRQRVAQLVDAGRIQSVPVGARGRGYTRTSVEKLAEQERGGGRPKKATA